MLTMVTLKYQISNGYRAQGATPTV